MIWQQQWNYALKPLRIDMNTESLRKLEDNLEKYLPTGENVQQIKRYFEEAKQESVKLINIQLGKYREISQMGKSK